MSPGPGSAGLYVHIPFCSAVCPYCDFAVTVGNAAARADFVQALCAEIALWTDWCMPIDTIYFGGGTPSALTTAQLTTVLTQLHTSLPITAAPKIFFEANPEDVTPESLQQWRGLGVNMLSLGVQSFVDSELRSLGRRHNGAQARRAVDQALQIGFETVSVDIMFGLPKQTVESLRESLLVVQELRPQHVSCYQLTIHDGTTFARWRARGKLTELDEDLQADLYGEVHTGLQQAGLHAYEVSNFARSDAHRSAHNLKYWQHVPYLGLGPSAHSFDGEARWWNHRDNRGYIEAATRGRKPIAEREQLCAADLALEGLMLGIRTAEGIELQHFKQRYQVDLLALNLALIEQLIERGYLQAKPGWLTPTRAGLGVADGMAAEFALE
jgi:oxygen-independent coproporphyrinogen III oxidase